MASYKVKTVMLVCVDCLTFTSNGTVFNGDGDDVTNEHGDKMVAVLGDTDLANMVLGGKDQGFFGEGSTCDGCGDNQGGQRYTAFILVKDQVFKAQR